MNREFLQLAQDYDPIKHYVQGWYMSEKLDGMRAFWDGGLTRGILCSEIPFANNDRKGGRLTNPVSTGLWSRYGNPIYAPDWWLDYLPKRVCLDGELYMGRKKFQTITSICKKFTPSTEEWRQIRFCVFEAPGYFDVFANGRINNPNFKKTLDNCVNYMVKLGGKVEPSRMFKHTIEYIKQFESEIIVPVGQELLPVDTPGLVKRLANALDYITDSGGEGLMLRGPGSFWVPKRTSTLLKVKALKDSEATVVGYRWGRKTDKESKFLGLMGAMIVDWNGKRFDLSGFTEAERFLTVLDTDHPGEVVDSSIHNPMFPRGSRVTFQYRELTDEGIPKEARYYRKAD